MLKYTASERELFRPIYSLAGRNYVTNCKTVRVPLIAVLALAWLMPSTAGASSVSISLENHWALVHVVLTKPLPIEGEAGTATGYYRNFGISCGSGRVRALLESHVTDGRIDWYDSEVGPVDPARLDPEIRAQVVQISDEGVWYESGRSFHGTE